MKPYALVLFNFIKLNALRLFRCHQLQASRVELINCHMRFRLNKNAQVRLGDRVVSDGHGTILVDENAILQIGARVYFN